MLFLFNNFPYLCHYFIMVLLLYYNILFTIIVDFIFNYLHSFCLFLTFEASVTEELPLSNEL